MRPGLPAWHNLASQNVKYAYRYQNDETSWSYETRAAPIAMSEFEIQYALSKITKLSDKFICFPTSHSLCIIRFALIFYDFCEAKQDSLIYASSCDVQKERYA